MRSMSANAFSNNQAFSAPSTRVRPALRDRTLKHDWFVGPTALEALRFSNGSNPTTLDVRRVSGGVALHPGSISSVKATMKLPIASHHLVGSRELLSQHV